MNNIADLRIVFMGTPEFAVASLDKLLTNGCNVVGVVTSPDKPGGRGMALQESAVKKYAREKALNILQPEKLKDPDFIEALRMLKADMQIVVAFRMLPEIVWNMPPMGTINVHGSLLPQYRGAAPINWAVINGESETGVTTFRLQHAIDTGNILLQKSFPIAATDNAGVVHDTMKEAGAGLLLETLRQMMNGTLKEQPQDELTAHEKPKHAPKIFTETCAIDFTKTTAEVYNLIRGLSPYPTAFTFLNEKKLKIFSADKLYAIHSFVPGEMDTDKKTFIRFACSDGLISVKELQLEGKKKMKVEEFLRGFRF